MVMWYVLILAETRTHRKTKGEGRREGVEEEEEEEGEKRRRGE